MKHLPFILFLLVVFALASCDYQRGRAHVLERRLERMTEDRNWWRDEAEKLLESRQR